MLLLDSTVVNGILIHLEHLMRKNNIQNNYKFQIDHNFNSQKNNAQLFGLSFDNKIGNRLIKDTYMENTRNHYFQINKAYKPVNEIDRYGLSEDTNPFRSPFTNVEIIKKPGDDMFNDRLLSLKVNSVFLLRD